MRLRILILSINDTQHNYTEHNETQHNFQLNGTQHNDKDTQRHYHQHDVWLCLMASMHSDEYFITLSVIRMNVVMASVVAPGLAISTIFESSLHSIRCHYDKDLSSMFGIYYSKMSFLV